MDKRGRRPSFLALEPGVPRIPLSPAPSPVPMQRFPREFPPVPPESSILHQFGVLNDAARIKVIQQMLRASSRDVLVACRDFIKPMLKHDPFNVLPVELSLRILRYIKDPKSLAAASQVSRLWYHILRDDHTWKHLCETHHFRRLSAAGSIPFSRPPSSDVQLPAGAAGSGGAGGAAGGAAAGAVGPPSAEIADIDELARLVVYDPSATRYVAPTSYRSHFKQQYLISSSWEHGGRLAAKYVLNNSENIIATMLIMKGDYIVVALDNSRILVFGLDGRLISCLYGHVMGVWALDLEGDTLVSGGCDDDIRVWDLKTGVCMRILQGHTSTVRCLVMHSPKIAISSSRDSTIRVWNVESGECLHVLTGHTDSVRRLEISGDYLVSASYDHTARVWRISTGELVHTLRGHLREIYSLAVAGNIIATGSLDMTIGIWDLETGAHRVFLQGHLAPVTQLQLRGTTLVSGGSDSAIRVWNLDDLSCVHRIAAHDDAVTCLQFDYERIVSGAPDGAIHVWDLKTGKHVRTLEKELDEVWGLSFREDRLAFVGWKEDSTVVELLSFVPS